MEVRQWTYDEYPEYRTDIPDAVILDTTGDEIFVSYYPDVQYADMDGVNLRENPELRRKLSVECNISKDTKIPPVLIFHGTKDRTVNPEGSALLYKKLKECGKDAEIVFIRGADHGGGEFWSESVMKIVDRFVKRVI